MARERDLRLDVLKAVAILLVVFGHVIRLVYVDATRAPLPLASAFSVLALLDVPLFAFVSGYLAPARPGARWVGRRALQLLVPYVAWSLVRWLVYYRTDLPSTLVQVVVWREGSGALWFLYALFIVSALYALVARSTALTRTLAVVCALVPMAAAPFFSIGYVLFLFPVFVAGRWAGERKVEPGPWVLAVAAVLLAAMWAGPGANLIFAAPPWAVSLAGTATWSRAIAAVAGSAARLALALALIGSAFYLARGAKRGAWLGALTLGIYALHPFFMPAWARNGGVTDVVWAYAIAAAGASGVTMLLARWRWTAFLLLGTADVPWLPAKEAGGAGPPDATAPT